MKEHLVHDDEFVPIFNEEEMLAWLSELHYKLCDTEFEFYTDLIHDVYEYIYEKSGANYPEGIEPRGLLKLPGDIRVDEGFERFLAEDMVL